jgi:lambda family phage holin
MPDRPESWAKFWDALTNPLIQGAIMAILISFLRVLYDSKETNKCRIFSEAMICGGLSLSASSIISWMAWPENLSVAAGGAIGFLGVTAIREILVKFLGRKADTL